MLHLGAPRIFTFVMHLLDFTKKKKKNLILFFLTGLEKPPGEYGRYESCGELQGPEQGELTWFSFIY